MILALFKSSDMDSGVVNLLYQISAESSEAASFIVATRIARMMPDRKYDLLRLIVCENHTHPTRKSRS